MARHQLIDSEKTINQIIGFDWGEAGTDLEDEMPTPVSSPTQIVVPAIPPVGTADPFGRGDGFDLDLAKVMCDVSVLPSMISPLQDVEVPSCSYAADYAAPATPAFETVMESPGLYGPRRNREAHGYWGSSRYQRLFGKKRGAACGCWKSRFRLRP